MKAEEQSPCGSNVTEKNKGGGRELSNSSQTKSSTCKECSEIKNLFQVRMKYQIEVESMREERERLYKEV